MKLFAAMSGGVDSAVAALLLRRAGHDVVGIHLRTGVKADPAAPGERPRCCGTDEAADARRVCSMLDIPFFVQNTERDFSDLIRRFADAYAGGATPNPCVACNTDIKFGALLERARALGADAVATGHYARRVRLPDGRWALLRARDVDKDQSYVLYGLGQDELAHVRFPLGDLTKEEVRALAREAGLPVAEKRESQEICFVPGGDYRELVRDRRPDAFRAGDIVDAGGRVLGRHEGVGGFTVGQRKGLGLAAPEPLYVLRVEPESATVVVGTRGELGVSTARVRDVVWSSIPDPTEPLQVAVMLRYRSTPVPALVCPDPPEEDGSAHGPTPARTARLEFEQPAWPVTPGQAAVFYVRDPDASESEVPGRVLGGGTLVRTAADRSTGSCGGPARAPDGKTRACS